MADKQLKDKAMKIKGKDYVQVKDRILYLSEKHPDAYSIDTEYQYFPEQRMWVVKAYLLIGANRYTGLAQEVESDDYKQVNHTSALENCETSAVGRACAMAGIGVLDSIASVDEINKANNQSTRKPASEKQMKWMMDEAAKKAGQGVDEYVWLERLLTVKPESVPSWKIKDAIDLIRKQPDPSANLDVVVTDIPDTINLDDIPY